MSRLTLIEPCFVTTLRKKRPQTAEHIQIFLDLINNSLNRISEFEYTINSNYYLGSTFFMK